MVKVVLSLIAQLEKNPPAMQETPVPFLGWEAPLKKERATHSSILGLPWWLRPSRIRLQCRGPGFDPWVGKIPWRREWQPTAVFWPGEFHALYSPWGLKESDTTEQLSFSLPCKKPLQRIMAQHSSQLHFISLIIWNLLYARHSSKYSMYIDLLISHNNPLG